MDANPNEAEKNITRTASLVAAVLAHADQLALVEVTGKPEALSQCVALTNAGFILHGLVGIVNGKVEAAPINPLDAECMFYMGGGARMLGQLASAPVTVPEDASVSVLENLFKLEDPRSQN